MKMKLSDYIWKYLSENGVQHVFMLPGGGAMHLVDSLGRNKELQYIVLLHEQACTMACETYSRVSENALGVTLVTSGPGATNTITGVAAAWLESTPCLIISGQAKISDMKTNTGLRQKGSQEIGIVDIVKSITKYAVTITNATEIKYHLQKAIHLATEGRQGPVWLDIPLDIQAAMVDTDTLKGYQRDRSSVGKDDRLDHCIEETINLLKEAKRPVMIAGQGIARAKARVEFQQLVEKLQIPVLTTWLATELLAYDHPMNMGKPGMVASRYANFTMQNADCVICIGTRLDPAVIGFDLPRFAPDAKKVIVDIDEAEINKLGNDISLKICSNAKYYIDGMLSEVSKNKIQLDIDSWLKKCNTWKYKYPIVLESDRKSSYRINPYYFFEELSKELGDYDMIVPGSSGATIDIFWMTIQNKKNQKLLATGSLGSMGYGLPASIGACIASGRKRTICIEGDGSFQLNIQELSSVQGMNLPIKIFILNNGGYLSISNMQKNHFNGNLVASDKGSGLYIPDILHVARAYGIPVLSVDNHEDIGETIRKALCTEGPVVCEIQMDKDIPIRPKVNSKVQEDGSMKSSGLEDLWPFLCRDELEKNTMF